MRNNSYRIWQFPFIAVWVIVVLAFSPKIFAQEQETSIRSSIAIQTKIGKKIKFEIEPEYRLNNSSSINSYLLQTGINYETLKWLSIGAFYRFEAEYVNEVDQLSDSRFAVTHRFAFDANSNYKIGRFNSKFRVRYCNFSDFDAFTDDKSNFFRYKIGLEYNIKGIKLTPFVASEFYHKLNSGLISKTRYTLGFEYNIDKRNSLSIGYSFDKKYSTLDKFHIVEISYSFQLK